MHVNVNYLFNECGFNDKCDQRKPLKCIAGVYVFVSWLVCQFHIKCKVIYER